MAARVVGPAPKSTAPITTGGGPSQPRPLPPDLLRDASKRLGITGLLAAVLWVSGTILYHLALPPSVTNRWSPLTGDAFIFPGLAASIGMYVYSRNSRADPRFILDLGLGYMVFTALLLGLMFHWDPMPGGWSIMPIISWTGAITVIFAAIIPSTPLKTFIAGFISVSMNPIGMLISRARGVWDFDPAAALTMHYPDYLLVGVAVVISHVMTGLGQQIAKAREMGSYELGDLLGAGGMGEVYKAKHRMLARPAAIKLIRPEMIAAQGESADLAISRFKREADTAARLRSPHTVSLYDFGVTDDHALYLVMELLEGMTLETLVHTTGPLPAGRAIHLLRQACDSLEEAHALHLVHRDIKPANIHVGRVGLQDDFVKVLDFGLVKAIDRPDVTATMATMATFAGGAPRKGSGAGANAEIMTNLGLTPGTPAYMAPEVVKGESIDGRSDLYALGCVADYLLTGRLVFEANTVMQMLVHHMSSVPVPPSQRTELPVPAELDAIVLACLAKDPNDRPQTAAQLSAMLASVPVEPWDDRQAAEWWKRRRGTTNLS